MDGLYGISRIYFMVGGMAGGIRIYEWLLYLLLPVGILFYLLRISGIIIPVFSDHLNDLLFIPLVISIITIFINRILRIAFRADVYKILFAVIACSFYFEYYLPGVSSGYTRDFLDVCCYFAGGLLILFVPKLYTKS